MMESSDHRELDDLPVVGRFHLPRFRGVFLEREMRPEPVIVDQIISKYAAQVTVVEDDYMIDAVAAQGSDHGFHVRTLPG